MITESTTRSPDEVRLDPYLAAIWRAKWILLLVIAAAVAATLYYSRSQETRYTASATLEIGRVWKDALADTYVVEQMVNTPGFKRDIAQKIGVKANLLKQNVQATTITAGPNRTRYPILLRLTASATDEAEAVRWAQAVADEVIARHEKLFTEALAPHHAKQLRLEKHLEKLTAQAGSPLDLVIKVEDELDDVKFNNTSPTSTKKTEMVEPVVAEPIAPPSGYRNAAAAGVLAALAGVGVVALLTYINPVIRSAAYKRND